MDNRKKILILIEWFAPGYKAGGPIQSCINICTTLSKTYDIYVYTTDTDHGETKPYDDIIAGKWITDTNIGVKIYYAPRNQLSAKLLTTTIREISPDFIYLNLFFSPHFVLYPIWLKISNKIAAKMILCPRGTLYDSAISLKWYKKKPMLTLMKWFGLQQKITFHATNQREADAIHSYFPKGKLVIANNLPNTLQTAFSTCIKTAGSLKCIFIARIVPIKNLLLLLQLLKKIPQHVILTVIGPVENEHYWELCKKTIRELPENIIVQCEGPKQNSELPGMLKQHHLFILPTTGENFGHAIFEALLAGRPVLISDQTPWLNLEEHKAGWAIALNEPEKYVEIIQQMAGYRQDEFDHYAVSAWNYASQFINNPKLAEQYKILFS